MPLVAFEEVNERWWSPEPACGGVQRRIERWVLALAPTVKDEQIERAVLGELGPVPMNDTDVRM